MIIYACIITFHDNYDYYGASFYLYEMTYQQQTRTLTDAVAVSTQLAEHRLRITLRPYVLEVAYKLLDIRIGTHIGLICDQLVDA